MRDYFLIESRDPFECAEVHQTVEFALSLAQAGHRVRLFLVQNGVLPARRGARSNGLAALSHSGVPVLADEDSLRERGIGPAGLVDGITTAPLELVVDALDAGAFVLWQ